MMRLALVMMVISAFALAGCSSNGCCTASCRPCPAPCAPAYGSASTAPSAALARVQPTYAQPVAAAPSEGEIVWESEPYYDAAPPARTVVQPVARPAAVKTFTPPCAPPLPCQPACCAPTCDPCCPGGLPFLKTRR
jgi:hypothetical protein